MTINLPLVFNTLLSLLNEAGDIGERTISNRLALSFRSLSADVSVCIESPIDGLPGTFDISLAKPLDESEPVLTILPNAGDTVARDKVLEFLRHAQLPFELDRSRKRGSECVIVQSSVKSNRKLRIFFEANKAERNGWSLAGFILDAPPEDTSPSQRRTRIRRRQA